MKPRHLSLLLCSTFLFTSSIVSGEAFTAETREYFALNTLVPEHYQSLKYVEFHDPVDTLNQINLQSERAAIQDAWSKKNAQLEIYSPEYYRHQAELSDWQAQWFPEQKQYYTQEKLDWLVLAKKAEQRILQDQWDIEEAAYAVDTPEWFEFKAKVEGAKAEWCDQGSEDYTILKSNQRVYLRKAERAKQKKALDIEEATYTVDTLEWLEFKARVEGAKAEWYDRDSENYATLKSNQGVYLQKVERIRQKKAWDIEEAAYTVDTPEWCEFKAKVEGAKAEWYDRDSENYATLKSNQKVYLLQAEMIRRSREEDEAESDTESEDDVEPRRYYRSSFGVGHSIPMGAAPPPVRVFESLPRRQTAAQTEAQRLFDESLAMMDRFDDLDAELGAPLRREEETEVAAETQRQPQTSDLTSPIPAELPLVEELEAQRRRQEEAGSAAEAQRQDRISVGVILMGDPSYLSVVRLIATIFVSSEFAGLDLTNDDQAEIMFYIPQEIKDRMYGLATLVHEALLTGDVISRIRERDWSAFSEIIVDFDIAGDEVAAVADNGEPTTHAMPEHIYATPEIEDLLQSTLKSELKAYLRLLAEDESISEDLKGWLNTEMESFIDQHLQDIYRNYDARKLNKARQTLLGASLSYVSEVSFRSHDSESLAEALIDSRWEDVSDSVYVIARCITDAEIQGNWSKIYDSTRDLDPKRAFDPNAPFTDREESQVAALIQGISREAAMVTTLECIFLKERAEALFNNLMGI